LIFQIQTIDILHGSQLPAGGVWHLELGHAGQNESRDWEDHEAGREEGSDRKIKKGVITDQWFDKSIFKLSILIILFLSILLVDEFPFDKINII